MDGYQACKVGPGAGPLKFKSTGEPESPQENQDLEPQDSQDPPLIDLTDEPSDDEFGCPTEDDIHKAIAFEHSYLAGLVKQEPIDLDEYANRPLPVQSFAAVVPARGDPNPRPDALCIMSPHHLEMARGKYKNRFYRSTLLVSNLEHQDNVQNWLITTSTLAGLNSIERIPGQKPIISLELPGAQIADMWPAIVCELSGIRYHPGMRIVICAGLNDFLNQRTLVRTKLAIMYVKQMLKDLAPYSSIVFVTLPLAPRLSVLSNDVYEPYMDKTAEIIEFNEYLKIASDHPTNLRLQHLGVTTPVAGDEQLWEINGESICTGTKHVDSAWREDVLSQAVHLSDDVRKEFWETRIIPYFNQF